jgi:hypothetical protein
MSSFEICVRQKEGWGRGTNSTIPHFRKLVDMVECKHSAEIHVISHAIAYNPFAYWLHSEIGGIVGADAVDWVSHEFAKGPGPCIPTLAIIVLIDHMIRIFGLTAS